MSKWHQGDDKSKPKSQGGQGGKPGVNNHGGNYDDGQWKDKWADDRTKWHLGVDKSKPKNWGGQGGNPGVNNHGGNSGANNHGGNYDDGQWKDKWADDRTKWHLGVDESKPKNWGGQGGNPGANNHGGNSDDGQWKNKWADDRTEWQKGVEKSKWNEEKYGWKNYQKRSEVVEDEDRIIPTSAISSFVSSTNVQTLEELIFFLKLVLCVLLSGYVFVWAYFVVPTWKSRKLQDEFQAHAATPSSVPVQDTKA